MLWHLILLDPPLYVDYRDEAVRRKQDMWQTDRYWQTDYVVTWRAATDKPLNRSSSFRD
jgi:hypothetical protein